MIARAAGADALVLVPAGEGELKAGERVELTLPAGHNTAVVLRKGEVVVNGASGLKGEARIATLSQEGEAVVLEAAADSDLVMLSGEPINEPVASYGPFVMNTREEIIQAIEDYEAGRLGIIPADQLAPRSFA